MNDDNDRVTWGMYIEVVKDLIKQLDSYIKRVEDRLITDYRRSQDDIAGIRKDIKIVKDDINDIAIEVESIRTENAESKGEIINKMLEQDNVQKIDIKELQVIAKESGRLGGEESSRLYAAIIAIILIIYEALSKLNLI